MEPKLVFWAAALALLTAVVVCAGVAWHAIRHGRVERHRRFVHAAALLIGVFLLAYLLKVWFLGKEQLASWSPWAVVLLRVHETIVLVMLVAGVWARLVARRFAPAAMTSPTELRRRHRRLGRAAMIASFLALATAAVLLIEIFRVG